MKKQHGQLTQTDREYLVNLIRKGHLTAKTYRRALGLLELDRGQTYTAVSKTLKACIPTLSNWAALYKEKGLIVLQDEPRTGHPIQIDGERRAKITALACSQPPEGYARWSLRLLRSSRWKAAPGLFGRTSTLQAAGELCPQYFALSRRLGVVRRTCPLRRALRASTASG
jgi:putative transposase